MYVYTRDNFSFIGKKMIFLNVFVLLKKNALYDFSFGFRKKILKLARNANQAIVVAIFCVGENKE